MESVKTVKKLDLYVHVVFEYGVKVILVFLIAIILATMGWVVAKSAWLLVEVEPHADIHDISKMLIVNVLMILALLEVFRTTLIYFTEGRVKVTFIIDTALVVVLTEVMGFWFKEIEYQKLLMVIALVFTLIISRVIAIRFSPTYVKLPFNTTDVEK